MKKLLIVLLLLSGCSTVTYEHGNARFSRTSFGADTELSGLEVDIRSDGSRRLRLESVSQSQTKAIEAAARGAAQGAK